MIMSDVKKTLSSYDHTIRGVEKFTGLKPYLVGGAVRDAHLGRPSKDVDLVVVGGHEKLKSLGFTTIKKDFPVFTHPEFPNVEVALARGEKKVGSGHTGFNWHEAKDLKTDLHRRDLTVNSMAYHPDSGVIDPFGGVESINSKELKPVSDAFQEDPLRTFRAARFASQIGFDLHPELVGAMRSTNVELHKEPKDRVRGEMEKALKSPHPRKFFDSLKQSDSLEHWFPEVLDMSNRQSSVPHSGSAYEHTMAALQHSANRGASPRSRELILTQQMGRKGANSFGSRLGYRKNISSQNATHSDHHLHTMRPRLGRSGTVDYWRAVRPFEGEHLDAAHSSNAISNGPKQSNITHYRTLFSRIKNSPVKSGSGKEAALLQQRNSLKGFVFHEEMKADELINIFLES